MGREVRMVPRGWQHPKNEKGNYIPLLDGNYADRAAEWDAGWQAWQRGEIEDYFASGDETKWKPKEGSALECARYTDWAGPRPSPDDYMPDFPKGTATMYMMYENTSEGTPISPAFATAEELARWLADNNASAFAGMTATYEQWLATINRGFAPSAMMSGAGLESGVAALAAMDHRRGDGHNLEAMTAAEHKEKHRR